MRKAPSLNGGIAPDFLDKGTDFAFLCVRPALHHRQIVQAFLVGFLLLFPFLRRDGFVAKLAESVEKSVPIIAETLEAIRKVT